MAEPARGSGIWDDPYYWRTNDAVWGATDPSPWSATANGEPGTGHAPGYPQTNNIPVIENGAIVTVTGDLSTIIGQFNQFFIGNGSTLRITSSGTLKSGWTYFSSGALLNLSGYFTTAGLHVRTDLTISSATADRRRPVPRDRAEAPESSPLPPTPSRRAGRR